MCPVYQNLPKLNAMGLSCGVKRRARYGYTQNGHVFASGLFIGNTLNVKRVPTDDFAFPPGAFGFELFRHICFRFSLFSRKSGSCQALPRA